MIVGVYLQGKNHSHDANSYVYIINKAVWNPIVTNKIQQKRTTKIKKRENNSNFSFFFFSTKQLLAIFSCSSYSSISTRTLQREKGRSRVFLEDLSFGAVCVKIGYMEKVGKVILRNLP